MKTKPSTPSGLVGPSKPRKCASVYQVCELEKTFESDPRPSHDKRIQLAKRLDMMPRTVQIWFQNRRAKARSQNHLMVKSVNCSTEPLNLRPLPFMNKPIMDLPYCFSPPESLLNSHQFEQALDYNLIDGINDYTNSTIRNSLATPYMPSPPDVTSPANQSYYDYPYLRFNNSVDSWGLPFPYQNQMMDFNNMNSQLMKSMSIGGMVGGMSYPSELLPMTWSDNFNQDLSLSFPSQPPSDNLSFEPQDNNINISL